MGVGLGVGVYAANLKLIIDHRVHECHASQFGQVISHCEEIVTKTEVSKGIGQR